MTGTQKTEKLDPFIQAKRKALQPYKDRPTQANLSVLQSARNQAKSKVRECVNDYWSNLCSAVQQASDTGNINAMYDGIKKAVGPTISKSSPLKSKSEDIISDRTKQLERWVEHYFELYSRENTVSKAALDAIERLTTLQKLDDLSSLEDVSKATDQLPSEKVPCKNCIPGEVIKAGNSSLLEPLHNLKCWEEGEVPQDIKNANIITLYKNKGDRSDCNNYRGISLLNIVGKLFARIILRRLQMLAERIYPESKCGFRSKRSTDDMIFSLRQLQEKCR